MTDGPQPTRCFLALTPPTALGEALAEISDSLAEKTPGVRWTVPKNMHLTLRFFAEADGGMLARIEEAAAATAARSPAFNAQLHGVGGFPHLRHPNVVWVGVGKGKHRMAAFRRALDIDLYDRNIPPEHRPFSPHLTLARVQRQPKAAKLDKWLGPYKERPWGDWRVETIELIHSRLTPTGPVYTTAATWALSG